MLRWMHLDDQWARIPEAIDILQDYFERNRVFCVCQRDSSKTIRVYFFDAIRLHFGIAEKDMRTLIKNAFTFKIIPNKSQATASSFTQDWMELEDQVRRCNDNGKQICLLHESNGICLFGLSKLVRQYEQAFETLKGKQAPQPCRITLSEKQVRTVRDACSHRTDPYLCSSSSII